METKSFESGLKRYLVQATAQGFAAVEAFLVAKLQEVVGSIHEENKRFNVPYNRPSKSGAKTHTFYARGASAGGPPGKRTGFGQSTIASERSEVGLTGMTLRIGVRPTDAKGGNYMMYLDQGISYPTRGPNKGRGPKLRWPWAMTTVEKNMPTLKQLFTSGSRQ